MSGVLSFSVEPTRTRSPLPAAHRRTTKITCRAFPKRRARRVFLVVSARSQTPERRGFSHRNTCPPLPAKLRGSRTKRGSRVRSDFGRHYRFWTAGLGRRTRRFAYAVSSARHCKRYHASRARRTYFLISDAEKTTCVGANDVARDTRRQTLIAGRAYCRSRPAFGSLLGRASSATIVIWTIARARARIYYTCTRNGR